MILPYFMRCPHSVPPGEPTDAGVFSSARQVVVTCRHVLADNSFGGRSVKRIGSVALCGALGLCAVACDSAAGAHTSVAATSVAAEGTDQQPTSTSGNPPTTIEPATPRCGTSPTSGPTMEIKVWSVLGGTRAPAAFSAAVSEFNSNQKQIHVTVENAGGASEMLRRLQDTSPSEWPDVLMATPQSLRRLADTGRVIVPHQCEGGDALTDSMLPAVQATYRLGGTVQAVPFGVSTTVLMYDAAEMRAAGLDPTRQPRTLAELSQASAQIVARHVSQHGLVVSDWAGYYLIINGAAQRRELIATPANGHDGGATTVALDTPANRAALDWLSELMTRDGGVWIGVTPSGVEDLTRVVDPVDGGTMTLHSTGSLGDVIGLLDGGSFPGTELGVGPMPGPAPGGQIGGNGLFLIDHGDPARAGAAFALARWLSKPESIASFDAATGYLPPSQTVADHPITLAAWAAHPQLKVGWDQVRDEPGDAIGGGPIFGPNWEVDGLFHDTTTAVVVDHLASEPALARLTSDVNALLDQYQALVPTVSPSGG